MLSRGHYFSLIAIESGIKNEAQLQLGKLHWFKCESPKEAIPFDVGVINHKKKPSVALRKVAARKVIWVYLYRYTIL